jgi:hypothetical protein
MKRFPIPSSKTCVIKSNRSLEKHVYSFFQSVSDINSSKMSCNL